MKATPQFRILTGMLACSEVYESNGKKYLTNDINPFYGQSVEYVRENIAYASEIYKKVFTRFINSCRERKEKLPPAHWGVLVL